MLILSGALLVGVRVHAAPIPAAVEPAELHIQRTADNVTLTWPAAYRWSELQVTRFDALPFEWQLIGVEPQLNDDHWSVTLPVETRALLYRLVSPLNHVLVIGQSLGMGAYGFDLIHTNQPFQNKMFIGQQLDGSLPDLQPDDLSALVPLVEQQIPSQNGGETIASGFANWISAQVGPGVHDFLLSNAARGGANYELIKRQPAGQPGQTPTGTPTYLRSLDQVEAGRQLAGTNAYRFRALLSVHGEGDNINQQYDANIREWRSDYQADVQRLTGQTHDVPMFHTQISAWGNLGNATRTVSPFKMLAEHERDPLNTILVGPKYFLPYQPQDGLHLTGAGYAWLGEYYAKAYYQQVMLGQPWSPLRPVPGGITRVGNIIEIQFTGQVGDLVFDTNLVTNPQGEIYDSQASPSYGPTWVQIGPFGFEYWDTHGSGNPWICSTVIVQAEVVPPDIVRLTLNQTPLGLNRWIRYGYTALPMNAGGGGGPESGPRGCLRDSDPAASRLGQPLYNWCVHFDKPCP